MIEDVIGRVLTGETQAHALDFIAFLKENGIALADSDGYFDVQHQGKNVCNILITGDEDAPGPWTIWSDQEPGTWVSWGDDAAQAEVPVDARTREVAWAHVNPCASCGGDCSPGQRKVVLGRAFDGLCSSALAFTDPDADALACAKEMVLARMRDIS